MLGERFLGVDLKEEQLSRRNFLVGIGLASAVALPMLSAPARAAVSMLRTGLDPDLVETESEVIPAGKRGGGKVVAVAVTWRRWQDHGGGGKDHGGGGRHHGGGGRHHGGGGRHHGPVKHHGACGTVMAMDVRYGHGGRWWGGRWYGYGGTCWLWTPSGWIWTCGW